MKKEQKLPEMYDQVKHLKNESFGTVIASYNDIDGTPLLDVRADSDDTKGVWYHTLARNWRVVTTEEKLFL